MKTSQWELTPEQLRARFDPAQLPFKDTGKLEVQDGVIGQERAVRAMDFGLHVKDSGYNVFVCGVPGTGRSSIVKSMIRKVAESQPAPDDWCYVHNFADPDGPKALSLPAGSGRELRRDMERLIVSLREEFQKVFEGKEYQNQRRSLEENFSNARENLTEQLEKQAKDLGFTIRSTKFGILAVPLVDGKPVEAEKVGELDPRTRAWIHEREEKFVKHLQVFEQQIRDLKNELNAKIEELNEQVARYSSGHFFDALKKKYESHPKVLAFVEECHGDVLLNFKDFLPEEQTPLRVLGLDMESGRRSMTRYTVNVVVDHGESKGAPVVEEANPTYSNLVGRIEKKSRLGTLYTDFSLIKAGSILQASGGYLLLDALDVLRNPFSWDALKRFIKNREVKIEDIGELYGVISSIGIKPEPIPIHVRVILVGNPYVYYLLQTYDEDFAEVCKVKVDFDVEKERDAESPMQYAAFVARTCREEGLLHFNREAVATLLEQTSRWANHQKKLSLRFRDLADLVREASYWAQQAKKTVVAREDVLKAIDEKIYRSNLIEEHIRELISEGTLMVDVDGAVVGQANGLSVHELGDFVFGRPSRITARVFLGQSGVLNIEREARLSGKTHSKGVLILSGYLAGRYAREVPLALSATVCFEQSYGEVEGDSASALELVVLLSALSDRPIRQGIAMTGSVNQRGEVQAVGGVNEKIEGFYGVCKAVGLTGDQGVIIPKQNVKHLMLRDELVAAAASGRFHVYAVSTVDEALEVLTGAPAGAPLPDGSFPEGTVNADVTSRLKKMAETLRELEGEKRAGRAVPARERSED
jgi:lon-related putative ATP-dependent protease